MNTEQTCLEGHRRYDLAIYPSMSHHNHSAQQCSSGKQQMLPRFLLTPCVKLKAFHNWRWLRIKVNLYFVHQLPDKNCNTHKSRRNRAGEWEMEAEENFRTILIITCSHNETVWCQQGTTNQKNHKSHNHHKIINTLHYRKSFIFCCAPFNYESDSCKDWCCHYYAQKLV